jgi:prevent-host-death family protein
MRSVGIRELRERTSEIIRLVRDEGAEVLVTHYGRPVARLLPIPPESTPEGERAQVWAELDQLAAEIGARWQEGASAAEAVAEGRREL